MNATENQSQLRGGADRRFHGPDRHRWSVHLGVAGVLFFLIKGLIWIGVVAAAGFGWIIPA
ncbi:MAG: hypothetical protein KC983_00570 [Phycisphaerales bacterium]|nr:hypothetical protein [Phycisphaerales bacterium]